MIINSIALKNFKSYGNNFQKVSFDTEGQLILLSGDNEVGKSSLIEAIDFTLYGTVRGKNKSKIALSKLPNRINKNLETEINFINDDGDNIIIQRKLEPTSMEVFKNTSRFTTEFKNMSVENREKFIGLEYNIYKSLISLNLSDFANFVNLDIDTKRKLLNKLFNLTEIDEYFSISKEILKNSYKEKERIESNILSHLNTINTYKENIENINLQSVNINKDDLKKEILSYRETYLLLKHEISDLNISINQLTKEIKNNKEILDGKKNKISNEKFILQEINKKINIFKSGICPTCDSELNTEEKKHKLIEIEESELNQNNDIDDLLKNYTELVNDIKQTIHEKNTLLNDLNEKNYKFNEIDIKIKNLKRQYDTDVDYVSLQEINRNITKLENENLQLNKKLDNIKEKISFYEKTVDYLSEKGIRKNIIGSIINPINENLEYFLKKINSKFSVKLDNEFDAIIKERFVEIDSETLSMGGAKKINIAIALSYIKTILELNNKRINILFLDEVFSSVSPTNINIILELLKDFAKEKGINIVIVHHVNFDTNIFDRVIHIEMKYFSTIIDSKKTNSDE